MVKTVRLRPVFTHPVTVVVAGWSMFVVGAILAEPQWLKLTMLLAEGALP
jgi:hypothetical protein